MRRHVPSALAPSRRDGGFTLLELLVAISLFGLLSILLYNGVRLGTRAWEKGETTIADAARTEAVQRLLRNQISDARPIMLADGSIRRLAFEGDSDHISFIGVPPRQLGGGGLVLITLRLVGGARSSQQLVMSLRAFDPQPTSGGPDREEILLEGIRSAGFAFFGAKTADDALGWFEDWQDAVDLPSLVRLRLTFIDGKPWPDLVIAPRLIRAGPGKRHCA